MAVLSITTLSSTICLRWTHLHLNQLIYEVRRSENGKRSAISPTPVMDPNIQPLLRPLDPLDEPEPMTLSEPASPEKASNASLKEKLREAERTIANQRSHILALETALGQTVGGIETVAYLKERYGQIEEVEKQQESNCSNTQEGFGVGQEESLLEMVNGEITLKKSKPAAMDDDMTLKSLDKRSKATIRLMADMKAQKKDRKKAIRKQREIEKSMPKMRLEQPE